MKTRPKGEIEMKAKRKWIPNKLEGKDMIDMILNQSNIKDKDYFLNGTIEDTPSVLEFKDGEKALKILKDAIKKKEKIGIHYDYDTDGVGGGSAAFMMLKELGANVYAYSNNRFKLGYGICTKAVDEMLANNPDTKVILTIDNGISAFEGLEYAKSKGLTVILTDHHEPDRDLETKEQILPIADAIINPKVDSSGYPFNELCGAAVVWKLISGLYEDKKDAIKYLDIIAISTVGDVVPLIDENRIIVKEGLRLLREEKRLSLKVLKEETETDVITSDSTLGFLYSPIFNAISRLNGDISPVFDMLISNDVDFLRSKCEELININDKRKEITNSQLELAEELLVGEEIKEAIVLYDESFDEGVVGLIAGRIKEEYNRPTIVFTKTEDGSLKGSGRSIDGFNMKEIFDKLSDITLGSGGHYMAGGLSIEEKNLGKFTEEIMKIAKDTLTEEQLIKKFEYNFGIKEEQITHELIRGIDSLEPFGQGFPSPIFRIKDFKVSRVQFMGKEKEHLKLMGERAHMIAWRSSEIFKERGQPLNINALGRLSINSFRDVDYLQFMVLEDNFY